MRFTEHLEIEGIRPSIGTVGDAYDNSLMESIIGLFKTECIRTDVFHEGPLPAAGRRRVRHRGLGRLVEQPPSSRGEGKPDPGRVRARLLRS